MSGPMSLEPGGAEQHTLALRLADDRTLALRLAGRTRRPRSCPATGHEPTRSTSWPPHWPTV